MDIRGEWGEHLSKMQNVWIIILWDFRFSCWWLQSLVACDAMQSGRSVPKFYGIYHQLSRWWRQQNPLKCQYSSTRLHDITCNNTATISCGKQLTIDKYFKNSIKNWCHTINKTNKGSSWVPLTRVHSTFQQASTKHSICYCFCAIHKAGLTCFMGQ